MQSCFGLSKKEDKKMFSKKKSLAKIARLRSKKDKSPSSAVATLVHQTGGGSPSGEMSLNNSSDDDDDEEDDDNDVESPCMSDAKRMSWHSEKNLQVPLRKESSISTPNLNGIPLQPKAVSNLRRATSRNHSLKYSSGALHGNQAPCTFDHTYDGEDDRQAASSLPSPGLPTRIPQVEQRNQMRRRVLRKKTGGSVESNDYPSSSSSDSRNLHSPRRTQSVRMPPIVRIKNEDGVTQNPAARSRATNSASPVRITRSPSARYVRRFDGELGSRPNSPSVPNPNHFAAANNHRDNDDYYDSDELEDDSYYNEQPLYGTPPHDSPKLLDPGRGRKDSVTKSRSMTSLTSGSDPLAQSYNAINASQARTRSYLLGSVGATSLLGPQELEKCFPDRTLRLFVGTWNMNGKSPPRHLAEFLLPQNLEYVPDILVVGTQESFPERNEWEVRLQDTLGPSHVLFQSTSLGTLHQAVFLRRDLIWYCSMPETDSFNTRPGAQFRTKGAVATAFLLFGTSFLFVNSHLTAHQENTKDRIKDYKKINAMLNLPKDLPTRSAKHKDISDKFDCVFWSGDLNFRLEQTREVVIREVRDGVSVLDFDQLNYLRQEGLIFKGFREEEINFPPTYKYDTGSNKFDTSSKQRTPSYTDRILYKCNRSTEMSALCYDSVQDVLSSDHKPVWGIWEVKIRPGRDTIPLAGGLFNRDVYIDGLKRRAEALQPVLAGKLGHNSHMCSIQ